MDAEPAVGSDERMSSLSIALASIVPLPRPDLAAAEIETSAEIESPT